VILTSLDCHFSEFRYHALLRSLTNTSQARLAVATAVGEFWKHSPQHIIITLEKLLTYRIIDAQSIVNWIFSHQILPLFTKYNFTTVLFCLSAFLSP